MSQRPRVRPSGGDAWANLRHASSPLVALRGFFGNSWTKMRRRDNCCGQYGEPGC
jgi:hypothetical protein